MGDVVADALTFTGTLFAATYHAAWMLVALGIGLLVGWRVAEEPVQDPAAAPEPARAAPAPASDPAPAAPTGGDAA